MCLACCVYLKLFLEKSSGHFTSPTLVRTFPSENAAYVHLLSLYSSPLPTLFSSLALLLLKYMFYLSCLIMESWASQSFYKFYIFSVLNNDHIQRKSGLLWAGRVRKGLVEKEGLKLCLASFRGCTRQWGESLLDYQKTFAKGGGYLMSDIL